MKLDYPKATSIDNAIPCGQWGKNNVPIYKITIEQFSTSNGKSVLETAKKILSETDNGRC